MTNPTQPQVPEPTGVEVPQFALPPVSDAPQAPAEPSPLDVGTYGSLVKTRSENRLDLDGTWHQISPRYAVEQQIMNVLFLLIALAAGFVLGTLMENTWVWIPAGIIALITVIAIVVTPRQARAIGYRLRKDDLVFRKGILWQRIVAVPYGRMQLVDITHGPLDRGFGLAQLKMVTAAAVTGVNIPGLTQASAEVLRDTLIDVAETRRTGL